jgi:hypothetical protein
VLPPLPGFMSSYPYRSFAFRVRAFAAALEALIAIALRSFAVRDLARAGPPFLPSSDITVLSVSGSIIANITP